MQLRYSFRLYPSTGQRAALARAFGCVRVVFSDALRIREEARAAGLGFVASAELSKRLTAAKKTPQRAWLGEVSAVVLQQSLRDLDTAYRNFFDGLKGKRPKTGAPRFKSKRDNRQSVRFTANASWRITPGKKLRLPKIGDVKVKWSRVLPSTPSTVTVVKDAVEPVLRELRHRDGRLGGTAPGDAGGRHRSDTSPSSPTAARSAPRASCAGPRRSSSGSSSGCPVRPRAPATGPKPG